MTLPVAQMPPERLQHEIDIQATEVAARLAALREHGRHLEALAQRRLTWPVWLAAAAGALLLLRIARNSGPTVRGASRQGGWLQTGARALRSALRVLALARAWVALSGSGRIRAESAAQAPRTSS